MTVNDLKKVAEKEHMFIISKSDGFLTEQFLNFLKQKLKPSFLSFNFITLNQSNVEYNDAENRIMSIPFVDDKKLVYFPEFYTGENKKNIWNKKEMERFITLCENLPENIYLLINMSDENRKNKFTEKLEKNFVKSTFERLNASQLKSWIKRSFKEKNILINNEDIEEYIRLSGYLDYKSEVTLREIQNDLDKWTALCLDKGRLNLSDLSDIFENRNQSDVYKIAESVFSGNTSSALKQYTQLKKSADKYKLPLLLLYALTSSVIKASRAGILIKKGESRMEFAKILGVPPFAVEKSVSLYKKFSEKKLIKLLNILNDYDLKLKTGELSTEFAGEIIIAATVETLKN